MFLCRGDLVFRVSVILGCLSIWGRYGSVIRFLCVMLKIFPHMNIREDQARLHGTHQLLHPVSLMVTRCSRFSRQLGEMHPLASMVASTIESTVGQIEVHYFYPSLFGASVTSLRNRRSCRACPLSQSFICTSIFLLSKMPLSVSTQAP